MEVVGYCFFIKVYWWRGVEDELFSTFGGVAHNKLPQWIESRSRER
jgi:hypothetical protein